MLEVRSETEFDRDTLPYYQVTLNQLKANKLYRTTYQYLADFRVSSSSTQTTLEQVSHPSIRQA